MTWTFQLGGEGARHDRGNSGAGHGGGGGGGRSTDCAGDGKERHIVSLDRNLDLQEKKSSMMEVMDESDLERELEEADKVNTSTCDCSRCQRSMDKMCTGT